jgi:hypothetical protein
MDQDSDIPDDEKCSFCGKLESMVQLFRSPSEARTHASVVSASIFFMIHRCPIHDRQ